MSGDGWLPLDGVDPAAAAFPARAKVDGQDVIVFQIGDGFRAVQRNCPHQQASFADAILMGDGRMVRCALHGYTFRFSDGKGVNCPGYKIKVYEVMREADRLLARAVA